MNDTRFLYNEGWQSYTQKMLFKRVKIYLGKYPMGVGGGGGHNLTPDLHTFFFYEETMRMHLYPEIFTYYIFSDT